MSSILTSQSGLHQSPSTYDRKKTQLAYEANYFPADSDIYFNKVHKVVWNRSYTLLKVSVLQNCNEARTHYFHGSDPKGFKIHWMFNNIPTLTEWDSWTDDTLITVELRISPLIEEPGRVALLSCFQVKRKLY